MQRTACRGASESVHIRLVFTEAHQKLEDGADFFDRNKVGLVGVQCPLGRSGSRRASVMSAKRLPSFGEGPNEDQGKPGLTVKQSSSPEWNQASDVGCPVLN